MKINIFQKVKIENITDDLTPIGIVTIDANKLLKKIPYTTLSNKNIDGGFANSIYLSSQRVDGGSATN